MTSFEQARALILDSVQPLEAEEVEILLALGRTAAEDVVAPISLPVFDNSAMDGYALRAIDFESFSSLEVVGFVPAGAEDSPHLPPGTAVRIMTGAPVPESADSVVPLEETRQDEIGRVHVLSTIRKGQHIRRTGEDVTKGETVLPKGSQITVQAVNLLAAMGISSVLVHRKPKVAVLATGDELVQLGSRLTKGKIFDSNSQALAAAVVEAGATPILLGIAGDERESLRKKILDGLNADALITAAGVSVGDRDFVREVLAELGGTEMFWNVEIKPGKAMAFTTISGKPVFSLPGNPVSALLTFEELVRPALQTMSGKRGVIRPLAIAILQDQLRKKPGRVFFARVRLALVEGQLLAWSAGTQDTGHQKPLLHTDGIAVLPPESTLFQPGEQIKVHILSADFGMLQPELST